MSTLNNSLSTMKNDESQENNFLYTNEIIEQMSNDERRNSSCDLMKKIYPSDFRSWSIFNLLKPEFIKQIRMVMVYGDYANKALVVTKNKMCIIWIMIEIMSI
ncbi:uncharacterized protein LOC114938924 [Nylanderia fulva]|uniref:uncharacterized protein LOC114938924 n=1 Tax=Nylanderia fulva TaxID=613905 RepID=UPI0010FAE251|nr:uncharacterized protein LOC114938924 [Nylanderia fulva]